MQGLPMTRNCHQITEQKQLSGGCNLGAVANPTLRDPSPTTTVSERLGANN